MLDTVGSIKFVKMENHFGVGTSEKSAARSGKRVWVFIARCEALEKPEPITHESI